jgi:GTP diphosphokinase / guanosine-3',5'-bis(diphosphate) 3'-diphosphatase
MEVVIDLEAEKQEILKRYRKLRRTLTPYMKDGDANLIQKAFKIAADAHSGTRRKSGEPYIYHPIAVAQIVVEEINLGPTAVAAALLHDVVEDTDWSIEDIKREFGERIAMIVEGVTKIQSPQKYEDLGVSQQAENFRKMILTLSDDVRVILVKLADRLHNMRTLGSMDRHKQLKIASETIYIYAPLAHRLGLHKIKTELEDLYLKYQQPETYREIALKLEKTRKQRDKFVKEFIAPLDKTLKENHFKARVFGRPKSIYSIWNKIQQQGVPFEGIYDLFAIRIIIDSDGENEKSDCWRVYSMVTDFYNPNPDRLRDWISTPRANGYESLHTTVMGQEGRWVEVQIRTRRMDEIAEMGYAAHWKYKEHGKNHVPKNRQESGLDIWLKTIRELREQGEDLSATEFISAFRANFFREEVFVFTPKGELKKLPVGATVIDFAFDIHSEVGVHCLGAKVNQKLVPLDYELHNSDQVEIITSKQAKPSIDWLKFAVTTKAKTKIKEYIRDEKRKFIEEGKSIVEKKLRQFSLEFNDLINNQLRLFLNYKNLSDMFYDVGKGYVTTKQLNKFDKWKQTKDHQDAQNRLQSLPNNQKLNANAVSPQNSPNAKSTTKVDTLIIGDDKNGNLKYTLAKCCNPIPGDDVFGFITINDGIKVHRTECPNAVELLSNYGYRVIKAVWQSQKDLLFLVDLKIIGSDRVGLVRDVTQVISSDMKVNIAAIDIGSTDAGIFQGKIKLYVHNQEHLDDLIEKLSKIEGVVTVNRNDDQTVSVNQMIS